MKKLSVKSCILIMVFAIITIALVAFVPFVIGSANTDGTWNPMSGSFFFAFSKFPIFGDNGIATIYAEAIDVLPDLFGLIGLNGATIVNEATVNILTLAADYAPLILAGIIALDLVLALLLLIFNRANGFRKLCKVISIILGIVAAIIFVYFLLMLICTLFIPNADGKVGLMDSVLPNIFKSGAIWTLICTIISGILISKQFKWFSAAY